MSYRRFRFAGQNAAPATVATLRQFEPAGGQNTLISSATVATDEQEGGRAPESVAKSQVSHGLSFSRPQLGSNTVASVASQFDDPKDWQAAFDERAGHLEYDCHLPRAEAERIALAEMGEPPSKVREAFDFNTAPRQPEWMLRRVSETKH